MARSSSDRRSTRGTRSPSSDWLHAVPAVLREPVWHLLPTDDRYDGTFEAGARSGQREDGGREGPVPGD